MDGYFSIPMRKTRLPVGFNVSLMVWNLIFIGNAGIVYPLNRGTQFFE